MVVEWDLLPEEVEWRDEGCELFPSCLNCPLPRCTEEEPRGRQRLRRSVRVERMVEMRQEGKSVVAIAKALGVSKRTVQRTLNAKKNLRRGTR